MATIQIQRRENQGGVIRVTVNSASDARRHYIVSRKKGKWMCSCPAWVFKRLKCKHISHVKECLA